MNIQMFYELPELEVLFGGPDENGRVIKLYLLSSCVFTGLHLYYPNVLIHSNREDEGKGRLVMPMLERTMSLQTTSVYDKMNMTYDYVPNTVVSIMGDPVFFFIYNTDNYFHFLYDSLPYLISFFKIKAAGVPNLRLLMQYPNDQKTAFYPFVLELLEIVGIGRSDIVLVDRNTMYSQVYLSTSYTHDFDSNLPPRKEIFELYQTMVSNVRSLMSLPLSLIVTPPKIYVSRRTWLHGDYSNIGTNYTLRRRMMNEDELVERLVSEGYCEVFTERLTTIEKILYFAGATHVVGAIGGGIANVVFSPPETRLEAIVSPGFLCVNKRFKYSLDCVDVYYNYNTQHVETGEFKKYMRVKMEDGGIGEIEQVMEPEGRLIVAYTDGSTTGWNSECIFKQVEIRMDQVVARLDAGLNSPWILIGVS